MRVKRILSLMLSATMLTGLLGYDTVFTEAVAVSEENSTLDVLPDYIQEAYDFSSANSVSEIGKDDLYSITVSNSDGTYSTVQFFQPIKYFDGKDQTYKFIDNTLVMSKSEKYAYENKANSFSTLYPWVSSEGVSLVDDKYTITMIPATFEDCAVSLVSDRSETAYISYGDVYGENTELRYSTNSDGIKETLILNENVDFDSYSFEISLDGVYLETFEGKQIEFKDSQTDEPVFLMSPTFIQDSSEKENITYNNYYSVEQLSNTTYKIDVYLDKEFLEDKNTVYPCVVDPTVYYMRAGTIDGVYATQSGNTMNNNYFQVGTFNGVGECISYLKITGLENKKWVNPDNIINAKLGLYDCSGGYYNSGTVTCYRSNSIISTSSAYYSQLNSAIGETVASVAVSNNNQYYQFDITTLLVNWIRNQIGQGGYSYNYGCIFKGSTSLIGRQAYKTDTSSGSTYKPYLDIRFTYDEPIKDGIYKISSAYNSRYIQYNGLSSNVTASSSTYSSIDKWRITNTGDGLYTIQPYDNESEYLYVSSTDAGTYCSVSNTLFKWYITANTNGTYRIFPANTINIANAISYSGGNILLSAYHYGTLRNWNVSPVYQFDLINYYDGGYTSRFNNAIANIDEYNDVVSQIQMKMFGLHTNYSIQQYTSIADNCTGTPVSYNDTITSCSHSTKHKTRDRIYSDLLTQYGSGTNILSRVSWTGHVLDKRSSASYSNNKIIVMTIGMVTDSNNNNLSDAEIRKQRVYTLLHETSHQLGAPDHYCYDMNSNSCSNLNCWRCHRDLDSMPVCVMSTRWLDLEERLENNNLNGIYCDECMSSTFNQGIVKHLEDHHVTE